MLWGHIIAVRVFVHIVCVLERLTKGTQPSIYAVIYGATVADFPKAIFVMSAILLYAAVVMLCGIRPFFTCTLKRRRRAMRPARSRMKTCRWMQMGKARRSRRRAKVQGAIR